MGGEKPSDPTRRSVLGGIVGLAAIGSGCMGDSDGTATDTTTAETSSAKPTSTTVVSDTTSPPGSVRTPTTSLTATGTRTPAATTTRPDSSLGSETQDAKVAASDGDPEDNFGWSTALSGDGTTAIVGARRDEDPNGDRAGSAYVFTRTGGSWSQQTKLLPDDGDSDDFFGGSVAISDDGTTALVGAYGDEDPNGPRAGSAYVFTTSGGSWSQETKLAAWDGDSVDNFGLSVAISGDASTALIAAPNDEDPNGRNAGSAYVFARSGGSWRREAKLVADDGDSADTFGRSVAMSADGSTALLGAPTDEDPYGHRSGSAYLFSATGDAWRQETKLVPDDGDENDWFGRSVALGSDGTTALVGAWHDDEPNGGSSGSAYLFTNDDDSWRQSVKLAASDGDRNDLFGRSVALTDDGSTALVGAMADQDPNGPGAGSAYVFARAASAWRQRAKLVASDGDSDDRFGKSVAISDDGATALVGASQDEDPNGTAGRYGGAGSAYLFDLY